MLENRKSRNRSLIILAGGKSGRMGEPKPILLIKQKRLVDYSIENLKGLFGEILVVVKERKQCIEPYPCILDNSYEYAPIFGLYAGLKASKSLVNLVVACDMPFIKRELVQFLLSKAEECRADAVVPVVGGYFEPLLAVYNKSCIDAIEGEIKKGNLKITGFYSRVNIKSVSEEEIRIFDPEFQSFVNINTKEDLKAFFRD
ncbi:MAG: molybdenum cofactor guanylyltransferase [bacterium]|nr:molybdenum cofactor guanylyltransferase [bacterium]